jgi:hypothetical protein
VTVKMCQRGKHEMVGDTVGLNRSTGRVYCKPCREETRRAKRKQAGKCLAGKHSFAVKANIYETAQGQRRCRPCYLEAKTLREAAAAEAEAAKAAAKAQFVPPRKGLRTMKPRGYGSETDARYRLALMVRGRA